MTTAFVLGGGGVLGAVEVGMLRALLEREIVPDLVLGTSVGALNGAMVARQPELAVVERLTELWATTARSRDVYGDRPLRTVRRAVTSGTHIYSSAPLRHRLEEELGDATFEDLPVRLGVCAASIERAAEHWFTSGPLVACDPRQRGGARTAPARRDRRRALPRRRHGELRAGRQGRRAGRHPGLRAAGRPHRPAAEGAHAGRGRWPG